MHMYTSQFSKLSQSIKDEFAVAAKAKDSKAVQSLVSQHMVAVDQEFLAFLGGQGSLFFAQQFEHFHKNSKPRSPGW